MVLINSFHNVAVKRCDALMNQAQSIQVALNRQSDLTKKENRVRLGTSVDSVRYLLKQGLAFRGNDESKESKNKGNFRELVDTLADQNDSTKKAIKNAPVNCQWICPDIQKELANIYAKVIKRVILVLISFDVSLARLIIFIIVLQITLNSILEDIGGDVFSLLIDEASDVSDKEQMAVVLRYVDK